MYRFICDVMEFVYIYLHKYIDKGDDVTHLSGNGNTLHTGHACQVVVLVEHGHRVTHVSFVVTHSSKRYHRDVTVHDVNRDVDL